MSTAEFIGLLESRNLSPHKSGTGWEAHCPAHSDGNASLSVTEGSDGRILIHCHAGCSVESIVGALGLKLADLFPPRVVNCNNSKPRMVAGYDYTDETGVLLFQCVRYEPKNFKQRRPDSSKPGEWIWNLKGVDRVLYRMPEVKAALVAGRTIFICEGEKDCDALAAGGFVATCNPMGAGKWLPEHAETLRGAARVVVIADKDPPGRNHAQSVASSLQDVAKCVKLIELPDGDGRIVKDAADWFAADGTADELRELVKAAPEFTPASESKPSESGSVPIKNLSGEADNETFEHLARLSPAEYDRCRDNEAKRLSIRVGTLDAEVLGRRHKGKPEGITAEPWPDAVDGAELLDALASEFRKFLVLPPHADWVLALWTLHTYSWQVCEYSPIIAITSPVKSCGKSRVLDVLEKLVSNAFRTGNMSEAVLFRVLDSRKPSVLIDEFDTIPEDRRDALSNILKHGFHRAGRVHRIEGEAKKEVIEFIVFGPKALACIKLSTLDGPTLSRCINIRMQRKRSAQKVARLRHYNAEEWQRKCRRWTVDNITSIETTTPQLPDALGDREQDIWEPLFVLAQLAGGAWLKRVHTAALALCGESGDAAQDTAVLSLGWIQTYFTETGADKVSGATLAHWLNERQDAPFSGWNDGKGIKQTQIRRHLAGFEIHENTVRLDSNVTAKGYARKWFEDAFKAYLPETQVENGNMVTTPENIDDSATLPPVTDGACYHSENRENVNKDGPCYHVTNSKPGSAPAEERELVEADLL